ncbi:MAG: hypothetical protein SF123_10835 [Chloroflexota bacterium]|nr:hypothetical protein [Chloroflexota bacterium]
MEAIKLKTHIGSDGLLKIEMPTNAADVDAEVLVVYNVQRKRTQAEWEAFIDETYGSLADDPLERPEELALDVRDENVACQARAFL